MGEKMQADGGDGNGDKGAADDGVEHPKRGTGESQGGAYPNAGGGGKFGGFMGRGGQSEMPDDPPAKGKVD